MVSINVTINDVQAAGNVFIAQTATNTVTMKACNGRRFSGSHVVPPGQWKLQYTQKQGSVACPIEPKVTQNWRVVCSKGYSDKNGTCLKDDDSFCNSISLLKGTQQLNSNSTKDGAVDVVSTDTLFVKVLGGNVMAKVQLLPLADEKTFESVTQTVQLDLVNQKAAGSTYSVLASRGTSGQCSVLSKLNVVCPAGSTAINGECEAETDINMQIVQGISVGIVLLLCAGLCAFFIRKKSRSAYMHLYCACMEECVIQPKQGKSWFLSCRWK